MVNIELSEQYFDKSKFDSFCQRYKFIFPDSFLNYLIKYNDSELDSNIINGSERGIYVRYFYGTTTDMYSDIESMHECYERRLPSMCVPIGDADFGNLVCMSLHPNNYGKIYKSHYQAKASGRRW